MVPCNGHFEIAGTFLDSGSKNVRNNGFDLAFLEIILHQSYSFDLKSSRILSLPGRRGWLQAAKKEMLW